jgi:hypothetical protein
MKRRRRYAAGCGNDAGAGLNYRYYGSFAPGLENCVAEVLGERFPDLHIPLSLSGAMVFETAVSYDRLNLFCFNNIFQMIHRAAGSRGLEKFVRDTINRGAGQDVLEDAGREGSFRVIFSLENTPAAVGEDLRREAESYIASLSGLPVNRSKPGTEFWFLLRREGAFFMKRLSRHRPWDKLLHPGELPPPLAWVLCWLAKPRVGERSADPFCGYGSIPAARLRHFPPGEFFASDIDPAALRFAKNKFKGKPGHCCHFNRIDAGDLGRLIAPASLDSIITDPPWGFYGQSQSVGENGLRDLYAQSLRVFSLLLKPGGLSVILCGRGDELKQAAERNSFTIVRELSILLSGKKAAVFVLSNIRGAPNLV